jgi:hypothetical protein
MSYSVRYTGGVSVPVGLTGRHSSLLVLHMVTLSFEREPPLVFGQRSAVKLMSIMCLKRLKG